ncbi:prepilin-type N-terminal cleavage/methylation domain-containing protein [Methylomonas sp. EFPC1]|uniref:type IV pilin protein n=1 Tax=Methylomonas sp. EFPC1 TaxID=2812647 RepID=UPI001968718D|nr:prepilin-type N-terminal cleavage/methylation domain-containing protein [Methylomonas sp. EFPC1]QSB00625.1 prepilin-type N-terminal cleavage/methylation domain-containing protein [Methylomonas sp. EFPC1]
MYRKNLIGNGFTLIEMMLAVAIMAVLTAIAIPAYNGYIDKSKNDLAISYLLAIQTELERYYTREFHYPNALSDITSALPNNGKDPWGRDYVYLNIIEGGPGTMGSVRKDHALNPINTKYDLYSLGKNGVTKKQISQKDSLDDIILARDGGFVGLAADF